MSIFACNGELFTGVCFEESLLEELAATPSAAPPAAAFAELPQPLPEDEDLEDDPQPEDERVEGAVGLEAEADDFDPHPLEELAAGATEGLEALEEEPQPEDLGEEEDLLLPQLLPLERLELPQLLLLRLELDDLELLLRAPMSATDRTEIVRAATSAEALKRCLMLSSFYAALLLFKSTTQTSEYSEDF